MKILHIATYEKGGAAIAAIRLHRALLANGHDSKFLFFECTESERFFKYGKRSFFGQLWWKVIKKFEIPLSMAEYKVRKHRGQFESFAFANSSYTDLHNHPLAQGADVINLHWVANFLDYKTFFEGIGKPVIWTLHDMQPFQGGFHYKGDEGRNADTLAELDQLQYAIKQKALKKMPSDAMTVVAPSKWLLIESKRSAVLGRFAHQHIPYSIDAGIFKIQNRARSKEKLGLPEDKVAVLFVCEMLHNRRKGFDLILDLVKDRFVNSRCQFMAVGKVKAADRIPEIKYLGTVGSEAEMSAIYNAADLFIIPSREDNLPNTMIESLCCGTPVVGFSIGGVKESIRNFENGMLADEISITALKIALMHALDRISEFDREGISAAALQNYAVDAQAKAYVAIYDHYCRTRTVEFQG